MLNTEEKKSIYCILLCEVDDAQRPKEFSSELYNQREKKTSEILSGCR